MRKPRARPRRAAAGGLRHRSGGLWVGLMVAFPVLLAGAGLGLTAAAARAQQPSAGAPPPVRRGVEVTPRLVVLDAQTSSSTLTFTNPGPAPARAVVAAEYGFPYWPAENTAEPENPAFPNIRDTVIHTPKPTERSAAKWITGLPKELTLAPGETRTVTLTVTPPAGLADGQYYARVVVQVNPPKPPDDKKRDAKKQFKLPIVGESAPPIRDSVRVYYRRGTPTLGLELGPVTVVPEGNGAVRMRIPVHLTGTASFHGALYHSYGAEPGEAWGRPYYVDIYRDGVIEHYCEAPAQLPAGTFAGFVRFEATQDEFPAAARLPMQPVQAKSAPFSTQ